MVSGVGLVSAEPVFPSKSPSGFWQFEGQLCQTARPLHLTGVFAFSVVRYGRQQLLELCNRRLVYFRAYSIYVKLFLNRSPQEFTA